MTFHQLIPEPAAHGTPPPSPVPSAVTGALPRGAHVTSAVRAPDGSWWAAGPAGAWRIAAGKASRLGQPRERRSNQPGIDPDAVPTALTTDRDGHIWMATTEGIYVADGRNWWVPITRREGLPTERLTAIHLAESGDIWVGGPAGAARCRAGRWRCFAGRRWLADDAVTGFTESPDGVVIHTATGATLIREREMTLREKAAHYDSITQARHSRGGLIGNTRLLHAYDAEGPTGRSADDNDGLWTSYYVAAMCWRFAATGDEAARRQARESMNAMLSLEELTGGYGYPARSVCTQAEIDAGLQGYDPNDKLETGSGTLKWFRSPVRGDVWCKGDTSSDEIDGHFLAWYCYTRYIADDDERARIAATCKRVIDNIIAGGFVLQGPHGEPTRWGNWSPASMNDDPYWTGERPLNSLEILSHLRVAFAITGDDRYEKEAARLISEHHYLLNPLEFRRGLLADWWALNHSDDQLGYCAFYPIMCLETRPERRRLLLECLAHTWEPSPIGEPSLHRQNNSFFNLAYSAMSGRRCGVDEAIEELQDWPWSLVDTRVDNSGRADVTLKTHPGGDGRNVMQTERVLPITERGLTRWNASPYDAKAGTDGAFEHDGSTWLAAYWLGMAHKLIPPDA